MKLGLIGVNPITQLLIEIHKTNYNSSNISIYDDDPIKQKKYFHGVKVKGQIKEIKSDFSKGLLNSLHICLGEKNLKTKKVLFNYYKELGLKFPNFIHPSCSISSTAKLGEGNIISFGSVIGNNTLIVKNTSIWSGSVIEHDSIIYGNSYIGPNVTISGFVEVGECTLIGSGAVILPEVKIGKYCLIGAGAVVTKNISNGSIIKGNPAK